MSKSLEIIPCSLDDIQTLSETAIQAYRDFYLYLWKDDGSWYINRCFLPEQVEKEMRDSNSIFFRLRAGGEAIGFMKINIDQQLEGYEEMNGMELERIYLMKSASGKGFGRQALEFCFDFARGRNKELIWLKSMDSSQAIYFYQRLGFEECGDFRLDFEVMKPEFRGMKILMKRLI